ncbi:hypothetical protein F5I97DRAFT_1931762 [Phlebopus sp. FC_14]|nr:hypothetical protein F5I97DRAFT_1931762 [Phlebopus sp. FC_14]
MFSLVPVTSTEEQDSSGDFKAQDARSTVSPTTTAAGELDTPSHAPLDEAHNDFFGLPSNPKSIYHTGPAWPLPSGPQAQRVPMEARPVCNHAISSVWHELGEKIYKYFDTIQLKWTSIDPVLFAEAGKEPGPVFLWVGVLPGTLSPDNAKAPAERCKEILSEYGITDVEIAFRESIYTRYGLKLSDHVSPVDTTLDVRISFTPALGLHIAPMAFPYFGGTGCLYLCEGGESDRVFLLTARHVVLPPSKYPNELYHRKNNTMPRREDSMVKSYEEELAGLGEHAEGENPKTTFERQAIKLKLEETKASKAGVSEFHRNITSSWSAERQRILGHKIRLSSSSTAGSSAGTLSGATLFISDPNLRRMKKTYPNAETRAKFKYPPGGLMQLRDFVKYDELRRPTMLDANGEECFIVVKNGATTGVRLGRTTGIESLVREYKDGAIHSTSRGIAVYSYSNKDGAFSAPGDSGSVVGDANYRIVGMLTGGAGQTDSTDVSYLSAYDSLNECIKKAFPHSHLFPIRNPTPA